MLKTIITPHNQDISIHVPLNYVGKKVEVLVYAMDELTHEPIANPVKASRFKGLLSNEEAEQYHQHIKQARKEWERSI